jgi:hypothetical protein
MIAPGFEKFHMEFHHGLSGEVLKKLELELRPAIRSSAVMGTGRAAAGLGNLDLIVLI